MALLAGAAGVLKRYDEKFSGMPGPPQCDAVAVGFPQLHSADAYLASPDAGSPGNPPLFV